MVGKEFVGAADAFLTNDLPWLRLLPVIIIGVDVQYRSDSQVGSSPDERFLARVRSGNTAEGWHATVRSVPPSSPGRVSAPSADPSIGPDEQGPRIVRAPLRNGQSAPTA